MVYEVQETDPDGRYRRGTEVYAGADRSRVFFYNYGDGGHAGSRASSAGLQTSVYDLWYGKDHEGKYGKMAVSGASWAEKVVAGRASVEPFLLRRDGKRQEQGAGDAVHRESEGESIAQ